MEASLKLGWAELAKNLGEPQPYNNFTRFAGQTLD